MYFLYTFYLCIYLRSKSLLFLLFVITIKLTLWSANLSLSHSDSFAVQVGDHLRSTIICGPFWGSFAAWGSFWELYGTYLWRNIRELKQRRWRRWRERQKRTIGLDWQNNNFARAIYPFLYISWPSLHDYNVKMPYFTFFRGRERRQQLSFSFPWLWHSPLEFHNKKKLPTFDELNETKSYNGSCCSCKAGFRSDGKTCQGNFFKLSFNS